MGWQGYDNEGCMPGDKERFLRLQQGMRRRDQSSPSYTLAEIEQLARLWIADFDASEEARLTLSIFLVWLERREKEGRRDG